MTVGSAIRRHFAEVVSSFVLAWKDPAELFFPEQLAQTRKRAVRFAITLFALCFGVAGCGMAFIGLATRQIAVFGVVGAALFVLGPLFNLGLLYLEALFLRAFGPHPVSGSEAWHLVVAGVAFAQATWPVLIVPFVGLPLGLLLGARIIVSGMKKLGAQNGERAWLAALCALGLPFLLSLGLRSWVAETYRLPGDSMLPTLSSGDVVFVTKYDYGLRWLGSAEPSFARVPKLGDLVVFMQKSSGDDKAPLLVKRVVGLPGDEIEVRGDRLFRNGSPVDTVPQNTPCEYRASNDSKPQEETTIRCRSQEEQLGIVRYTVWNDADGNRTPFARVTVPQSQVFVLSDNRSNGVDSRNFGSVGLERLVGRVRTIGWSFSKTGSFRRERLLLAPH